MHVPLPIKSRVEHRGQLDPRLARGLVRYDNLAVC